MGPPPRLAQVWQNATQSICPNVTLLEIAGCGGNGNMRCASCRRRRIFPMSQLVIFSSVGAREAQLLPAHFRFLFAANNLQENLSGQAHQPFMSSTYFYLLPGAFSLIGFTYGVSEGQATRGGKIKVKLVPSGRWADSQTETVELVHAEIAPRVVTTQEALDGVGTFVGSAICTPRVPPGKARIWDYGLVVGYDWDEESLRGTLDVNFDGVELQVAHKPNSIQDVAVEIYVLRPCGGRGVGLIMPLELKQRHEKIYNKFNGVGQPAVRDSTALLAEVGSTSIDESKLVPLLDVTSFKVYQVTIQHILDYVYYKDGKRTAPPEIKLGDSIFSLPSEDDNSQDRSRSNRRELNPQSEPVFSDGLSDSEDDSEPQGSVRLDRPPAESASKRRRVNSAANTGSCAEDRMQRRGVRCDGDGQLQKDVDQLISLHRTVPVVDPTAVSRPHIAETQDKCQFQPTGTQTGIYHSLINGKYVSMTAQRFVEFVQIHWRKFGFFPHPAILRGLFGWDFGTRGLSIRHFVRVTEQEKRAGVWKHDMSNFSRKNGLPRPIDPTEFSTLIGTVEVLHNVALQCFKPLVQELFHSAVTFLAELRVSDAPTSVLALAEVAAWIDDRLGLFRVYVSDEDWDKAAGVKSHFSIAHESFMRVHQFIMRQELQSTRGQAAFSDGQRGQPPAAKRPGKFEKRPSRSIPLEIRKALPKQGGKEICLRFLSKEGCRGENGACVDTNRCHFKPAVLPQTVREFNAKKFGGISSDMQ